MIERVRKILESFDFLRKILNNSAICRENEIIIYDPPFTIKILRREEMIIFQLEDEEIAVLTKENVNINKDYQDYVDSWCLALASLGFKRYLLKNFRKSK